MNSFVSLPPINNKFEFVSTTSPVTIKYAVWHNLCNQFAYAMKTGGKRDKKIIYFEVQKAQNQDNKTRLI